jgi:hypothetical protein
MKKALYLNEFDARNRSVVSISQRSEELMVLYNLVLNLAISNPGLRTVQYLQMYLPAERFVFVF